MGRGSDTIINNNQEERPVRRPGRVDLVETTKVLLRDLSGKFAGSAEELVYFGSEAFPLRDGESANVLHGLASVEGLEPQPDGTFLVRFQDGEEVLVDLSAGSVAFASGDESDIHTAGALYSALAQRALNFPVSSRPEEGEIYKELAEAYAHFQDNPGDPEALRALALAAERCGEKVLPEDINVNDPNLLRRFQPDDSEENQSTLDKLSQRWPQASRSIQRILNGPDPSRVGAALLYQVNEDGAAGPPPDIIERNAHAADELAGGQPGDGSGSHLIPRSKIDFDIDEETGELISKGEYYLGPQEQEHFALIRNHMDMNGRFFVLAGPPGTGKDTLAEQFAAQAGMPFKQFNIGPDFDLEQALAGDVVDVETVQFETWVEKRDDKGKVIKGSDGEPEMEKIRVPVGVAPKTRAEDGELSRWLQKPSVVVLDEPEGMDAQMVRLHSIAGDRIESSEGRFITVNSLTGEEKAVHEDCYFFIAYNPGEGDQRFRPALHDRGLNLAFDYYDADVEAEILASEVTNIIGNLGTVDDKGPLAKKWTADDLMPMAEVFVAARDAHLTNPTDFPGEVGRRTMARVFTQVLLLGWEGHDDPVETAFATVRHLTHQGGMDSLPDRDKKIRDTISADQHVRLNDIAKWAASQNPDNIGDEDEQEKA
jgi:MoxR-like ATPase